MIDDLSEELREAAGQVMDSLCEKGLTVDSAAVIVWKYRNWMYFSHRDRDPSTVADEMLSAFVQSGGTPEYRD